MKRNKNKKSKMILSTTALALMVVSSSQFTYAANLNINQTEKVDVIVVFDNKQVFEKEKLGLLKSKSKINDEFENINGLSLSISPTEIEELKNNPNVKIIEEDIKVSINVDRKDWGIDKIKAEKSWTSGYTGKGVKIAVIDTGVDTDHDDLIVKGGASFVSYTSSYDDDQGHGTHVAGIIGAEKNGFGIVGSAPDADIYALKALDNKGDGYMSDIIAAIDWSITNKMDIVNLSLGSDTGSPSLQAIIDKAYANNVLIVAAAGNDGTEDGKTDTVDYPGRYDKTITVAAIDSNNFRATFSSTGNAVDFAAPGVDILSTYMDNQYAYMSGTSMAAPYVAGTLALYKEANPTLSNNQLRTLLESNVIDLGIAGKDKWYGLGLVQAPIKPPTNTTISTNRVSYTLGQKVYITTKVTDENGNALIKANVVIKITQPNGNILTYKGTTNSTGNANIILLTPTYLPIGKYTVNISTNKTNYIDSNASTTFELTK